MNHGKALRNKFGEALYRRELMFDKIMNKQMNKVDEECARTLVQSDIASLVFLNRVRQKRVKWIQDDQRYRDYYKIVCNNVQKKKLNTLSQSVDPDFLPSLNDDIQYKFVLLQQHLAAKKVSNVHFPNIIIPPPKLPKEVSFYEPINNTNDDEIQNENNNEQEDTIVLGLRGFSSDDLYEDRILYTNVPSYNPVVQDPYPNIQNLANKTANSNKTSNIPKLPKIKSSIYNINNARSLEEDFNLLYEKFSECDSEFLNQSPAKVEVLDTNIGKRFISDKKQKGIALKRQKQNHIRLQSNAILDNRFQNLITYLAHEKI